MTDYTIIEYIRTRRMTVAAKLLKSTDLNVEEIYAQVGYEDGSTFNRPFRARFGVTPLDLRKSSYTFQSRMVEPLVFS